jgi:type IV pilus assembly protein PilE
VKKNKGFTLIELLVVIAIISILAVIALYSYSRVRKQARDVRRREDIAAIAGALQLYYQDNNSFISMKAGVNTFQSVSTSNFASSLDMASILSVSSNKYIDMPTAALSAYPYYYCSSDGSNYALRAKLEIPRGNVLAGADNSCVTDVNYTSGDYMIGSDGYASKSTGYN